MKNSILITGYPYVRENFLKVFSFYPSDEKLFFLLPKIWKAKSGKVIYYASKKENIYTTKAFFYHSNYPIIGGLLKGWMPAFPYYLWRLKKRGLFLVYSCSEPTLLSTLYNGFWTKLFGLKHLVASWENIPLEQKWSGLIHWFRLFIFNLNLFFSDGLIAGNSKGAKIFARYTKKPIVVIPFHGLDPGLFNPTSGTSRKFREKDFSGFIAYTFIGAVDFRKGIHIALKAFKRVIAKSPNVRFIIAGSGKDEKKIEEQVKNLNIQDYVLRYPWLSHSEVKDLLSVSDIFVYPSISYGGWEEQFGYSMAEASLMEVPVISTRTGSIEAVVIDNVTGILVQPINITELAEAMIKLAKNEDLRKSMGQAGREHIIKNFSHKVVAQKFWQFFHSYYSK